MAKRKIPLGNQVIYGLHGMDPENDEPCEPRCDSEYCAGCAMVECPHKEPLHRHHDGCPACYQEFHRKKSILEAKVVLAAREYCARGATAGDIMCIYDTVEELEAFLKAEGA